MTIFSNSLGSGNRGESGVLRRAPRKCHCISDSFSWGMPEYHFHHFHHFQPVVFVQKQRRRPGPQFGPGERLSSNGDYRHSAPVSVSGLVSRFCLPFTQRICGALTLTPPLPADASVRHVGSRAGSPNQSTALSPPAQLDARLQQPCHAVERLPQSDASSPDCGSTFSTHREHRPRRGAQSSASGVSHDPH